MSAKSAMLVAILALFLCLSSTAAALYSPGNPVNCTAVAANCKTFVDSTYLGKKYVLQGVTGESRKKKTQKRRRGLICSPFLNLNISGMTF